MELTERYIFIKRNVILHLVCLKWFNQKPCSLPAFNNLWNECTCKFMQPNIDNSRLIMPILGNSVYCYIQMKHVCMVTIYNEYSKYFRTFQVIMVIWSMYLYLTFPKLAIYTYDLYLKKIMHAPMAPYPTCFIQMLLLATCR